MFDKIIKFTPAYSRIEEAFIIEFTSYYYGRGTCMRLFDELTGEPGYVATVNMPDELPRNGYVFIKNWNENTGILEALTSAGIVEPTGRRIASRYVYADECRLLVTSEEYRAQAYA